MDKRNYPKERSGGYAHHDPSGHRDDRETVRDAVTDGQVHYNAIKALSEKYPTAAATVIMDLTVEAEAFGAEIVFPENEVPSVVGRLLANEEDIEN